MLEIECLTVNEEMLDFAACRPTCGPACFPDPPSDGCSPSGCEPAE